MNEDIIKALQEERKVLESKIKYLPEGEPYILKLQGYIEAIDQEILELNN